MIIVLSLILGGCTVADANWQQVSNRNGVFEYVAYQPFTHDILSGALFSSEISLESTDSDSSSTIDILNGSSIWKMCSSSGSLWVIAIDNDTDPDPILLQYMFDKRIWREIEFDPEDAVSDCRAIGNTEILVLSNKGTVFTTQDDELLPVNLAGVQGEFVDLTLDKSGSYWILTGNGELYKKSEDNLLPFGYIQHGSRVEYTEPGLLWISSEDGVYLWMVGSDAVSQEIIKKEAMDHTLGIYNYGDGVLIVSVKSIRIYKDQKYTELHLPDGAKDIFSCDFDQVNNTLYIASDKGKFSLAFK